MKCNLILKVFSLTKLPNRSEVPCQVSMYPLDSACPFSICLIHFLIFIFFNRATEKMKIYLEILDGYHKIIEIIKKMNWHKFGSF